MASPPEISVEEGDISRRTLTEVRDDLRGTPWPRAPLMTISYHDVPLDAGQQANAQDARTPLTSVPEIELGESPFDPSMLSSGSMPSIDVRAGSSPMIELDGAPVIPGAARMSLPSIQVTTSSMPSIDLESLEDLEDLAERDTLVPQTSTMGSLPTQPNTPVRPAVTVERARATSAQTQPQSQSQAQAQAQTVSKRAGSPVASAARRTLASPERSVSTPEAAKAPPCDALELRTFVVPETELSPRSSDAQRRAFITARLSKQLPCEASQVRRVDVKAFEAGAVMLRVWCPVP